MNKFDSLTVIFSLITVLSPFIGVFLYFSSDETRQIFVFIVAMIGLSIIFFCASKLWWECVKELYGFFKEWRRKNEKNSAKKTGGDDD